MQTAHRPIFIMNVFKPPFRGAAWLVWTYYILCFLIYPDSAILKGNFPDPDDYLYLAQGLDWLRGQHWYDLVFHRMDPPAGVYIHYSRLLSSLYAGAAFLLSRWLDLVSAAIVVAAIIPPLFFAAYLAAVRWAAIPFMGRDWAGLTAFIAIFAPTILFQFTPGHVDHHGLEAVFALIAFGALLRMALEPERFYWPVLAGFTMAFGLTIGLEFLPVILVVMGWAGIYALIAGSSAARAGFVLSLSLAIGSCVFLTLTKLPPHWFDSDILVFSFPYVEMILGMSLCFLGVMLASLVPIPALRYVVGLAIASAFSVIYLKHYPELLHGGPYGALDPAIARLTYEDIAEAKPVIDAERPLAQTIFVLAWPLMACIAGAVFARKDGRPLLWGWLLLMLLLASSVLLAAFSQIRVMIYAETFSIIPLALMLRELWLRAAQRYEGGMLWSARAGVILLAGPLLTVLLPATADGRAFNRGVLLYPVQEGAESCDMHVLSMMLTMPAYYGDRPRVIMNTIDTGPELLFRTQHQVIATSTITNVTGNIDSLHFFTAQDPAEAEAIVRRRGVELVVMCRNIADMYVTTEKNLTKLDEQGQTALGDNASMAQKLVAGEVPGWLKQIHIPMLKQMILFEVLPPKKS